MRAYFASCRDIKLSSIPIIKHDDQYLCGTAHIQRLYDYTVTRNCLSNADQTSVSCPKDPKKPTPHKPNNNSINNIFKYFLLPRIQEPCMKLYLSDQIRHQIPQLIPQCFGDLLCQSLTHFYSFNSSCQRESTGNTAQP